MGRRLKDLLAGQLDPATLRALTGSYDILGDIAIILIPPAVVAHELQIAQAILAANPRVKVVAKRDGRHGGEFRTIPLQIVAGEPRLETEVQEFGVRLRLHPEKVYYSRRSAGERRRVAALVGPGEQVLVLFSGIAPYPLMLARYSPAAVIVGVEKNPVAHAYALENLRRNRHAGNIELHCGDVRDLLPALGRRFHRLIMPLPTMAGDFLPEALAALLPGGALHFYDFCRKDEFSQALATVDAACRLAGRRRVTAETIRCGHCGPHNYRICVDARID